jgi:5-methyltetrahydrofolate--homocysteine methyltransferase
VSSLYFTDEDWARIERETTAWWAGELERPLVSLSVTDPATKPGTFEFLTNFPLSMPAEEVIDRYEPAFTSTRYYGDAFPWWWLNFGAGMVAGFLGAKVNSVTEPSETVWFSPPRKMEIKDIYLSYDPENLWWKRVKEITAASVKRWGGQLAVSHADLGGNLDILASFRTTEGLLFDLVERPAEVRQLADEITRLWLRYYDELDALIRPACRGTTCWTPIWSTGKTYMLQCDFSYMISPSMFERFVMPDLIACCDHLEHGFYHLDGQGEIPHLEMLLSIERLRGIQWIPGDGAPPPEEWLPLLKRIRDGGKRCQVFVSPEGARSIVRNLGGRGFLLAIQHDNREFMDAERARAFLRTLVQEDLLLAKKVF